MADPYFSLDMLGWVAAGLASVIVACILLKYIAETSPDDHWSARLLYWWFSYIWDQAETEDQAEEMLFNHLMGLGLFGAWMGLTWHLVWYLLTQGIF